MKRNLILAILGALAAGALMSGCGLEGQPFSGSDEEVTVSPVISAEAIAMEKPGTAKETVLTWWRGLQTRNPDAVLQAYSKKARDKIPRELVTAMVIVGPTVALSTLNFDSVELIDENTSTVYVTIASPNASVSGPVGLPMEREDDKWVFSNSIFLEALIGSLAMPTATPAPSTETAAANEG